jgi:hypothetical protein
MRSTKLLALRTTTSTVMVWQDALQQESYDASGFWARSSDADVAEYCWTPPEHVVTGDFTARWWVSMRTSGTGAGVAAVVGADFDNTIVAGDEQSPTVFYDLGVPADEGYLSGMSHFSLTNGGCIALMLDADGAYAGVEEHFVLDIKQVDTDAAECNRK